MNSDCYTQQSNTIAKGYAQERVLDFEESFALQLPRLESSLDFCCLSCTQDPSKLSDEVKTEYLKGPLKEEFIFQSPRSWDTVPIVTTCKQEVKETIFTAYIFNRGTSAIANLMQSRKASQTQHIHTPVSLHKGTVISDCKTTAFSKLEGTHVVEKTEVPDNDSEYQKPLREGVNTQKVTTTVRDRTHSLIHFVAIPGRQNVLNARENQ
ncbi:hypothetical protein Tco_0590045 [Tanacetum coccineum]